MPKFKVVVKEEISVSYTVEAENGDEAVELVNGGTLVEDDIYLDDVYVYIVEEISE